MTHKERIQLVRKVVMEVVREVGGGFYHIMLYNTISYHTTSYHTIPYLRKTVRKVTAPPTRKRLLPIPSSSSSLHRASSWD